MKKPKVKLTEQEYSQIRDAALSYYKERAVRTTPEAFWGQCAAQAVLGVLSKKGMIDFELDLPAPDWKEVK